MKPATKIIGFTILGAVVGALLGFFYMFGAVGGATTKDFITVCGTGTVTIALIFLLLSSINEITKKKNRSVRRLGLIILIIIAVITLVFAIVFVISPVLPIIFFGIKQKCF